jgi:hypothetical protein
VPGMSVKHLQGQNTSYFKSRELVTVSRLTWSDGGDGGIGSLISSRLCCRLKTSSPCATLAIIKKDEMGWVYHR